MIFNKTKKGSAELYNLTGTWYKANDFTGISEDIVLAQNEVVKLIGKATFDRAHSRYMTDEYDPEVSSDDPEDTDFSIHSISFYAYVFISGYAIV